MKHSVIPSLLLVLFLCHGCAVLAQPSSMSAPLSETAAPDGGSAAEDGMRDSFAAMEEGAITAFDFDSALLLCSQALTDYYQAIRGFTVFDADRYIKNENLKAYTTAKIAWELDYRTQHNLKDKTDIVIGMETASLNREEQMFFLRLE